MKGVIKIYADHVTSGVMYHMSCYLNLGYNWVQGMERRVLKRYKRNLVIRFANFSEYT